MGYFNLTAALTIPSPTLMLDLIPVAYAVGAVTKDPSPTTPIASSPRAQQRSAV